MYSGIDLSEYILHVLLWGLIADKKDTVMENCINLIYLYRTFDDIR